MPRLMPSARNRRARSATPNERADSAAIREFTQAMERYKGSSGRMFPTWCEVLEVLRGLGYDRVPVESQEQGRAGRGRLAMVSRKGPQAAESCRILEAQGGAPRGRQMYQFANPDARDKAMDAVRQSFGWTSVEPR